MKKQENRRAFIKTSVGFGLATGIAATGPAGLLLADQPSKEPKALAAEREGRKWRRRRLIYNSDGCDVMEKEVNTLDKFLATRNQPILDTQVDSLFYCTGATTMFTHLAKVGETYGEFVQDDSDPMAVYARDNIRALEKAGHDTLAATIQFCKQNELEVFFSHRINDIHDTFLDWELSRWKREHPEYLMSTPEQAATAGGADSPKHWWSSMDFEKQPVLDYLYEIQRDVCARYNIDGMEIDYFRSPMFFRPNLDFEPAMTAQLDILTEFQRQLRDIAYEAGTKRGRPILMATRVPSTPDVCRHVGIDIERWLAEGLLDVLSVGGGYVPFTEPLDEMVQLARRYKVPIYATISASGMRGSHSSIEGWRGAAANMWQAGVDGIVTFNIFPREIVPQMTELGSKDTLKGLDKMFIIDPVRVTEGDLVQGVEQRQSLPITIPADGMNVAAGLPIGDDLPSAGRNGNLKSADLRIQLSDTNATANVQVSLNDAKLKPAEIDTEEGWLTFRPTADQYRLGHNQLTFRASKPVSDADRLADVTHVEVHVKYV